jgi:hypothetical protein
MLERSSLVVDLATAYKSRDENRIVDALQPILVDKRTTTEALLTLAHLVNVRLEQ